MSVGMSFRLTDSYNASSVSHISSFSFLMPSIFLQAGQTSPISCYFCPSTKANARCFFIGQLNTHVEFAIAASWAASTTSTIGVVTASTLVAIGLTVRTSTTTSANGNGQSLNNTALSLSLSRIHAVIDRKVAADHVRSRGSCVSGELVRFILRITRILPVVYPHRTRVTMASTMAFVSWIGPVTAVAKACKIHDIEHGYNKVLTESPKVCIV